MRHRKDTISSELPFTGTANIIGTYSRESLCVSGTIFIAFFEQKRRMGAENYGKITGGCLICWTRLKALGIWFKVSDLLVMLLMDNL
jgi:hypothetical protein